MAEKEIKALEAENARLENEVKTLKTAASKQAKEIETLKGKCNALAEENSNLQSNIDALNAENQELQQKQQKHTAELKQKDVLNAKLVKQVEKHNPNGKAVTPINGIYKAFNKKRYKFRDNASSFVGMKGKKLVSEEVMKAANAKDKDAIDELERLIKMDAAILVQQ